MSGGTLLRFYTMGDIKISDVSKFQNAKFLNRCILIILISSIFIDFSRIKITSKRVILI